MENTEDFEYYKSGYVLVKGEQININTVKVLDVEEDFSGRDLVTFEYNGEVRQSYVLVK
jgi:hypothetical protein